MSKNQKMAIGFNVVLITLMAVGFYVSFKEENLFAYFNNDVAVLTLIASVIYIGALLIKKEANFISLILRYISTSCLGLILFANFYMASTIGSSYLEGLKFYLTDKGHLFFNLLGPLVSLISFSLFEGDRRLNKKKTIYYALIPTVIYGALMLIFNVGGKLKGPYPFLNINDSQPIFIVIAGIVCLIANYLIARFILLFNQQHAPRRKK